MSRKVFFASQLLSRVAGFTTRTNRDSVLSLRYYGLLRYVISLNPINYVSVSHREKLMYFTELHGKKAIMNFARWNEHVVIAGTT